MSRPTYANAPGVAQPQRILFLWWGRRGAMSRFMMDLLDAAQGIPTLRPCVSVSHNSELIARLRTRDVPLLDVRTFGSGIGAVAQAWRIPLLRRSLTDFLAQNRVDAVVVLMSHVWTPLVASAVGRAGIPYVVIVHDAVSHLGDRTGRVLRWLHRDLKFADRVLVLSRSVADGLIASGRAAPERLKVLFHPDFHFDSAAAPSRRGTLRALFLGRIMDYKGLPLFVEALELLRQRNCPVEASVVGEGNLDAYRARLEACGAAIRSGWLSDDEIDRHVAAHDVIVLPYVEASQSGVASLGLGAGLPLVATPVGGLREQVVHGTTGLLAERVDAAAVADALQRLVDEPGVLDALRAGVAATGAGRSMNRFVLEVADICATLRVPKELPPRLSERST